MEKAKNEYKTLVNQWQAEKSGLQRNMEEVQRKAYLKRCFIATADIKGIGVNRKAMLRSYGIETAADVTGYIRVPGFGDVLISELFNWRTRVEAGFRFDPALH